jgi:uncharacterized protein
VKLVLEEAQSEALRQLLKEWPVRASSSLARAEVVRAAARAVAGDAAQELAVTAECMRVLDGLVLLAITEEILNNAAQLPPAGLRTLDAIHLATALSLGAELGVVVSYDDRLTAACLAGGISAVAPV